ncbi:hypothetical protein [Cohnella sp. REN36]|uniref:hypothetical protein n=1 Tax=Cohnella sp. REN36 TaxID=2887347 RepID=UPI001D1438B5|nr:hypothetical protein [Cohnella sp. REN36]MCC3373961.1 hypothetical protein [Cohnella sp. REN36]
MTGNIPETVNLFVLAGVKTAPLFMEGLREALAAKLAETGRTVRAELVFPYGDWSRSAIAQLREMRRDLPLGIARYGRSIGGRLALEAASSSPRADRTIWVGHSGGGVAAVHASGLRLAREGGEPDAVVMIGSPRCRIPPALRRSVLYLYAAGLRRPRPRERPPDGAGADAIRLRPADPICRIGSFGGWRAAGGYRMPAWQPDKHAPDAVRGLAILGGHADYFRRREPYVNAAGQSNLDVTLAAVWPWLEERMSTT